MKNPIGIRDKKESIYKTIYFIENHENKAMAIIYISYTLAFGPRPHFSYI